MFQLPSPHLREFLSDCSDVFKLNEQNQPVVTLPAEPFSTSLLIAAVEGFAKHQEEGLKILLSEHLPKKTSLYVPFNGRIALLNFPAPEPEFMREQMDKTLVILSELLDELRTSLLLEEKGKEAGIDMPEDLEIIPSVLTRLFFHKCQEGTIVPLVILTEATNGLTPEEGADFVDFCTSKERQNDFSFQHYCEIIKRYAPQTGEDAEITPTDPA